jgi:2-oxoglutarate ferredoxin oxidoreductase subunit alpha
MDAKIRIAGEAGQGVQSAGELLTSAFHEMGLNVFATQSYMSRIRGGVNSYDVRVSDAELFSGREDCDLLLALTRESMDAERGGVARGGVVALDGDAGPDALSVDMTGAAKAAGGARMANTVAAGLAFALMGYDLVPLKNILEKIYSKKGAEVAESNIAAAEKGAALASGHAGIVKAPAPGERRGELYSGSEAVGLGAATAGVKVVCSYPMTPSTGALTYLASVADRYRIVVEQAEDEICAVNLICGAAYAGAPAMTTTSGGGFSLMVEGMSLAGMLELPIVIMLSQRPGPATGLPTRTGQEDLLFAVHAGHGEFPKLIYAPGTIGQAFELTRRAFESAHKFQTPAIVMTDQFLTDSKKNIPEIPVAPNPTDRYIETAPAADYMRYAVAESGVSPRALPGGDVFVVCASDEHTADGHLTEDLSTRTVMQDKRMRKAALAATEAMPPEFYPRPEETALLCWGSSYGPCREAVDILRARGKKVCVAHFPQVWPMWAGAREALAGRRVVSVEGNSTAQFALLLRQCGAISEFDSILRYDGLPFTGAEIARRFKS